MKAFFWRIVYAAFFVIAIRIVLPLFFAVIGFSGGGAFLSLLLVCVALIAIAYVLFGPPPPMPF